MAQPLRMTAAERDCFARGRRCFEKGDVDGAMAAFGSLLETRSGFADVHYMVGVLHERRGDSESAMDSLREALRLNPAYVEALLALAAIYESQGHFERSEELAGRAAELARGTGGALDRTTRGKLANLQAALADAYAEAGELRDAIANYRRALERCPGFHDIRLRLGIALRDAGLPHQALEEFQRVIRGNSVLFDAHVQLGVTYYTLGRHAEALSQWQEVLRRDPGREDARMYLRLASAAGRQARSPTPRGPAT